MTTTTVLLPHHAALIRASGISDEVARERGYESITDPYDLGRRGFGEGQRHTPSILIPVWGVTGGIANYQSKPDRPRRDEKGKTVKYETPAKAGMCLDVPPRVRPLIGDPTTPLYITEGSRKADAAVSAGLCCIALLGVWNWRGKNQDGGLTALPDWESVALNGRDVTLVFDSDLMTNPKVRGALVRLKAFLEHRGARVKLIYLPPGPNGEKVGLDDYLAAGHTKDDLLALTTDTLAPLETDPPPPFPLDVFPAAVRRYIGGHAEAQGVPPDLIAVPFLAMAGGAIGNSRALLIKHGWIERPIIWTVLVGKPGTGKTPALNVAQHPLDVLQETAHERYRQQLADWEREAVEAKANKEEAPPRPQLEHFYTVDATTEALARVLAGSAGVTLIRDELAGWVKSHDAYRKGGDRESFLSLWAGKALKVDRRGADTLFVPRPVLCVTGGIQPDRLPELRGDGEALDGFIDRFVFSYPETTPHLWTEAEPDPGDRRAVERIFAKLRVPDADDTLIRLSPEARRVFASWYNDNARHVAASRGLAAGFASKLPGQLARLTLILHSLNRPDDLTGAVPAETVEDAIALVEYFAAHLARVLPAFGSQAPPRSAGLRGRVLRLLTAADGAWVDRTAINNGLGRNVVAEQITAVLEALAVEGLAEAQTVATGGRPREEWRVRKNERTKKAADTGDISFFRSFVDGDTEREVFEP